NTLKGILEDDRGDLWISSHKGISHFVRSEGRFINYGLSDGLQDYEFADLACLKSSSGEMFFGGIRGINAFFPEEIQEDTSSTSVILTQLQILNEPVAPQQELNGRILLTNHLNETSQLRLRYDESTLTLSFIGLNYPSPRKVHYQYMIENFDEDWIRTGPSSRFAKYTKLPPGSYIFKVRASNADGIWNGPVKTLAITVTPPWWKSQAAYACYLLFIVLLVIFFQQYSLIRIQRKNELVMQQFEKEKVEELAQVKLRFFTNVSHEFRTPLTLIQGYLEKAINRVDGAVRKDLQIIQYNARILLRLISELMDLQKFDQGKEALKLQPYDLGELAKQSLASFKWWAEQKGIDLSLELPKDPLLAWIDLHKIERVFYNLLSNAFKHTPKGGNIILRLGEDPKQIHISIQDDGAGIPKADQPFIFKRFYQATQVKEMAQGGTGIGLAYAKAIVEKHQGKLYFESEAGQGTIFFIQLPKGRAHLHPTEVIDSLQAPHSHFAEEDGDLLYLLRSTSPAISSEQREP
ncbi:MAG: ATP-binding protein, partial [Bacteroidota bacterium]